MKWSMGNQSQSCDYAMTSRDPERSNSWPQYDQSPIYSKTAGDAIQQQSRIIRLSAVRQCGRLSERQQVLLQWMTSFTRLYLEHAKTYILHSDGRQWISSWWLLHDHGSQQLYGLTDHRCFVHFISVEFSKYNIELVDLVDFRSLHSTQLSDDRLDRFRGLSFTH